MPFCKTCGSPVEGQFCAKCGTPVAAAPAQAPVAPAQPPQQQPYAYGQQYGTAAQPAPAATAGGMSENVAGLLCYIPFGVGLIISILWLVLEPYKNNKFIRFHAFQSLFFHIALFAIFIAGMIVSTVLAVISFALSALFSTLMLVVWLGLLVVAILLMVKAHQGQKWSLPIIGPLANKQA